jgi:hypothetical protein
VSHHLKSLANGPCRSHKRSAITGDISGVTYCQWDIGLINCRRTFN